MDRGREEGYLIDCAECWRLEKRGMRRGGQGKENRGLNPSLREGKREEGACTQTQRKEKRRGLQGEKRN